MWLSADGGVRLKSQSGIKVVTDKGESEKWAPNIHNLLEFYISSERNALLYVEVFGDFMRRKDEVCYAFDQSLGTGTIEFHRDESTWVKLNGNETNGNPELLVSIAFERAASDQEEQTTFMNTVEKVRDASEGDASGSMMAAGRSWRDRFSNVFSKALSTSSITPPSPPLGPVRAEVVKHHCSDQSATNTAPAASSGNFSTGLSVATSGKATPEPKIDDTSGAAVQTIKNFHDLHTDKAAPLVALESAPDKKSKRWRKSLALLIGEDLSGIDDDTVESAGNLIHRHSSGHTDDLTEGDGLSHSRATPSPTIEDCATTEPVDSNGVDINMGGEIDEGMGREAEGVSYADCERDNGCEDSSEPDLVPRRTSSVDSQGIRLPVDVHPLCAESCDPLSSIVSGTNECEPNEVEVLVATATSGETEVQHPIEATQQLPVCMDNVEYITTAETTTDRTLQCDAIAETMNGDNLSTHFDHMRAVEAQFSASITADRSVMGIFSESPCPGCGHLMFDDEVMATWGGFCGNSRPKDGDIISAHVILCPSCKADITPKLHVRKCHISGESDAISVDIEADVPYLSPYGLRYMVELIMAEQGFRITSASWLQQCHPVVYWNWLWYCARFKAPSGLFFDPNLVDSMMSKDGSSPWLGRVLTTWRECTLRSKAMKVINNGGIDGALELRDIFCGLSEEDLERIDLIMNNVSDGIHGVANLLIKLSQIQPLLDQFGGSQGRKIYMAVLTLVHFFKPLALVQPSMDLPLELSKVSSL